MRGVRSRPKSASRRRVRLLPLVGTLLGVVLGALLVPAGCAADDLSSYLTKGSCSADGKCAAGYECQMPQRQCVK